jgi:hypothetical protein
LFPNIPALYTVTGCSALTGDAAKTIIYVADNSYFSTCCGQIGLMENTVGVVSRSMFAEAYYKPAGTCEFGIDDEGGGGQYAIACTPVARAINFIAYFGSGNSPQYAVDYNGTNLFSGALPTFTSLATQARMTIGCSGDSTYCGSYVMEDFILTSGGLDATHRAAVYNNLNTFYSGL